MKAKIFRHYFPCFKVDHEWGDEGNGESAATFAIPCPATEVILQDRRTSTHERKMASLTRDCEEGQHHQQHAPAATTFLSSATTEAPDVLGLQPRADGKPPPPPTTTQERIPGSQPQLSSLKPVSLQPGSGLHVVHLPAPDAATALSSPQSNRAAGPANPSKLTDSASSTSIARLSYSNESTATKKPCAPTAPGTTVVAPWTVLDVSRLQLPGGAISGATEVAAAAAPGDLAGTPAGDGEPRVLPAGQIWQAQPHESALFTTFSVEMEHARVLLAAGTDLDCVPGAGQLGHPATHQRPGPSLQYELVGPETDLDEIAVLDIQAWADAEGFGATTGGCVVDGGSSGGGGVFPTSVQRLRPPPRQQPTQLQPTMLQGHAGDLQSSKPRPWKFLTEERATVDLEAVWEDSTTGHGDGTTASTLGLGRPRYALSPGGLSGGRCGDRQGFGLLTLLPTASKYDHADLAAACLASASVRSRLRQGSVSDTDSGRSRDHGLGLPVAADGVLPRSIGGFGPRRAADGRRVAGDCNAEEEKGFGFQLVDLEEAVATDRPVRVRSVAVTAVQVGRDVQSEGAASADPRSGDMLANGGMQICGPADIGSSGDDRGRQAAAGAAVAVAPNTSADSCGSPQTSCCYFRCDSRCTIMTAVPLSGVEATRTTFGPNSTTGGSNSLHRLAGGGDGGRSLVQMQRALEALVEGMRASLRYNSAETYDSNRSRVGPSLELLEGLHLAAVDSCSGMGIAHFRGAADDGRSLTVKLTEVPHTMNPELLQGMMPSTAPPAAPAQPLCDTAFVIGSSAAGSGRAVAPLNKYRGLHGLDHVIAAAEPTRQSRVEPAAAEPENQSQAAHQEVAQALNEIACLTSLRHPNIAQVRGWYCCACMELKQRPLEANGAAAFSTAGSAMGTTAATAGTSAKALVLRAATDQDFLATEDRVGASIADGADGAGGGGHEPLPACPPVCIALVTDGDLGSLKAALTGGLFGGRRHGGLWDWKAIILTLLDIVSALRHVHAQGLVHRAVQPSAVQLCSLAADPRGFVAKLAEFGLAVQAGPQTEPGRAEPAEPFSAVSDDSTAGPNSTIHTAAGAASAAGSVPTGCLAGPLEIIPPEAFRGDAPRAAGDVYGFGLLMWSCAHGGERPFAGEQAAQLPSRVLGGLRPAFRTAVPSGYRALAEACWSADPAKRPTTANLEAGLRGLLCHRDL